MNKYLVKRSKDHQTILDLIKDAGGNILDPIDLGMCAGTVVECTPDIAEAFELKPWKT
jgi:hypothetical protein